MRILLKVFLCLLALLLVSCEKKESKLHGTWVRDAKRTVQQLDEIEELNDWQRSNLGKLFSAPVVATYHPDGTAKMVLSSYEITDLKGKVVRIPETELKLEYEIISETDSKLVIRSSSDDDFIGPYLKRQPDAVLNFEGSDAYSISLDSLMEHKGLREFFVRKK